MACLFFVRSACYGVTHVRHDCTLCMLVSCLRDGSPDWADMQDDAAVPSAADPGPPIVLAERDAESDAPGRHHPSH